MWSPSGVCSKHSRIEQTFWKNSCAFASQGARTTHWDSRGLCCKLSGGIPIKQCQRNITSQVISNLGTWIWPQQSFVIWDASSTCSPDDFHEGSFWAKSSQIHYYDIVLYIKHKNLWHILHRELTQLYNVQQKNYAHFTFWESLAVGRKSSGLAIKQENLKRDFCITSNNCETSQPSTDKVVLVSIRHVLLPGNNLHKTFQEC